MPGGHWLGGRDDAIASALSQYASRIARRELTLSGCIAPAPFAPLAPLLPAILWPPMPSTATRVNIPELLANSRIGPLQKRVFVLCLMTLIIDGFDVQAMGFVIPALSAAWNIEP